MEELIADNIYSIIFLPFWIFLILMLGRFFSVYLNKTVIHLLTLFSSIFGSGVSIWLYKLFTPDKVYESTYPFIRINDFMIPFGIHIDRLSLIFAAVLFAVSFLVQLFAIPYMKEDKKQYRFFALINLFNFSLAGLFFSPNLFQTYVFWELAGVISYLLIGYEYQKTIKSIASRKVFIINRIGDTALIAGIVLCSYLLYEYAPAKSLASLSFFDMNTISVLIGAYTSTPLFLLICVLFIIASAVKSAQFPFYTWLQDAMEAKLPVSALLHSSTLVALGIYMTIRLMPFYTLEPFILKGIICLGIITAFICSLSACAQTNPKKTLAYSTSAQFGIMLFAIGVLNIKAGIALFCAHALIKSMLFITLPKENEKWDYTKFILFLIGGLSLSGVLLSGMLSKELFAFTLGHNGKIILSALSFITAFYIMRIALITANMNGHVKKKPEILEILSAGGFLILNILLYIYLRKIGAYQIAESFWTALTAWVVVYVLYIKNAFFKVPYIYELCLNGFYLDTLYTKFITKIYNGISVFLGVFDNEILGNYKPIIKCVKFGVKCASFTETNIMNRFVHTVTDFTWRISSIGKQIQTKNVQWYNFYGFIIITAILCGLVVAYVALLSYFRGV